MDFEETSVSILPIVAIKPIITNTDIIRDSTWEFTVEVNNVGSQDVSNVNVELQVENTYFEAPPAENLGILKSGTHENAQFDVLVRKSVENSPITAIITYDAGRYGTFTSTRTTKATAEISLPSPKLPLSWSMLIILIALIVGISVGIAVLRR